MTSQDRIDLLLPAPAAEYAVMADADLHMMALARQANAVAQILRRQSLADGADIVFLALDGQQAAAPDGAGIDRLALEAETPARQIMLLEDGADVLRGCAG